MDTRRSFSSLPNYTSHDRDYLSNLPYDVLYELTLNLNVEEIEHLCQTNTELNKLICDNNFWRSKFSVNHHNAYSMIDNKNSKNWYQLNKFYGNVWVFGDNTNQVLQINDKGNRAMFIRIPEKIYSKGARKIVVKGKYVCMIDWNDVVWTYPDNSVYSGEREYLGLGYFYFSMGIPPPLDILGLKAKDIAIGANFLLVLDYNNDLQMLFTKEKKGHMGKLFSGVISIAAGDLHMLIVDENGDVWAGGYNTHGQLGNSRSDFERELILVNVPKCKTVYAGYNSSFAIDNQDNVWAWGNNSNFQLGIDSDIKHVNNPVKLQFKCKFISPSENFTTFVDIDDDIRISGYGSDVKDFVSNDICYLASLSANEKIKSLPKCKKVSSGQTHLLMIDMNDNVINWGGVYGWNSMFRDYATLSLNEKRLIPEMGERGYFRSQSRDYWFSGMRENPGIFHGLTARDVACYKGSCFIISDIEPKIFTYGEYS
jgi:alpha-tubulin suppressor-like RCC1 family protein